MKDERMGVQDSVLALVVDEPRYGYELTKEIGVAPRAAVYRAIERLVAQGHVEPVKVALPELGGRRRSWYQATEAGRAVHARRIARQAARLLQEREITMASLTNATPEEFLLALDAYEQLLLQDTAIEPAGDSLVDRLLAEERQLVNNARFEWIARARQRIFDGLTDV